MQRPDLIVVAAHGWACRAEQLQALMSLLGSGLTARGQTAQLLIWDQRYFDDLSQNLQPPGVVGQPAFDIQTTRAAQSLSATQSFSAAQIDLEGLRAMVQACPDARWIGIGHSLGFAKLWQLSIRWTALVGLHGFVRFCPADNESNGTPTRLLDRMIEKMRSAPQAVLADFSQRMGLTAATEPAGPPADCRALIADLQWMRQLCEQQLPSNQHDCPLLWFETGSQDPIVPADLSRAHFRNHPHVERRLIDLPHSAPLTMPQRYTPDILAFLDPWS